MPKVPTYDNLQSSLQVMPSAQVEAPRGPTAGGIAAEQGAALGKGMLGLGNSLAHAAALELERVDTVRAQDAANQLDKILAQRKVNAYQLQGRAALERPDGKSLMDEETEALGNSAREIEQTLGNDRQKQLFNNYANKLNASYYGQIGSHVIQQQGVFEAETYKSEITTAAETAGLLYGDANEVKTQQDKVRAATDARIQRLGLNPEKDKSMIDAMRVDALSPLHSAVIKGKLSSGDSKGAEEYYKNNSAEMTLQARASLQDVLKHAVDATDGQGAANEVFDTVTKGLGLNDAVPMNELDAKLRERFKDSPDKLQFARAELDRRVALWNKEQTEVQAGAIEKFYAVRNNKGSLAKALAAAPELSEKNRAALVKSWREEDDLALSRSVHHMQLIEQERALRAAPRMLEFSINPGALVKKSPAEIIALTPEIGFQNAQHLLKMRQDYIGDQAKLSQGQIDNDMFLTMAAGAGFNTKPATGDREGAFRLLSARNAVEQEIGLRQAAKGKPLTSKEKGEAMSDVLARRVVEKGWISDTEIPESAVTPDRLAKMHAKITVPGSGKTTLLPLSTIPIGEYSDVAAELRSRGINPTPSAVAQNWYEFKNRKTNSAANKIPR